MKKEIDKINNFDFLRLFFACLVIVSHSFPLSGQSSHDPTYFLSNGQINLGTLSVGAFFTISGFLIIGSLNRSKNILDYLWKRIVRLYPGLCGVLFLTLITVMIINNDVIKYKSFWTYLPNSLLLYGRQYSIDGIFENNPYKNIINGSLWTLCYEFSCYIILIGLLLCRKNKNLQKWIVLITLLLCFLLYNSNLNINFLNINSKEFFRFSTYFFTGVFLYYLKSFLNNLYLSIISFAILIMGIYYNVFDFTFPLISYLILFIGIKSTKIINNISNKIGDLSYGVYIYGFIVQQTLMHYLKLDVILLIISSLSISLFFGYISWKFVEKPALKFKNFLH